MKQERLTKTVEILGAVAPTTPIYAVFARDGGLTADPVVFFRTAKVAIHIGSSSTEGLEFVPVLLLDGGLEEVDGDPADLVGFSFAKNPKPSEFAPQLVALLGRDGYHRMAGAADL